MGLWEIQLPFEARRTLLLLLQHRPSEPEVSLLPIIAYRKTSNISHTLVCTKIVDHSDVVGASPVGAAPTTSSYLT